MSRYVSNLTPIKISEDLKGKYFKSTSDADVNVCVEKGNIVGKDYSVELNPPYATCQFATKVIWAGSIFPAMFPQKACTNPNQML